MLLGTIVIYLMLLLAPHVLAKKKKQGHSGAPVVMTEKKIYHQSTYESIQSVPYYSFSGIQYASVLERFSEPAPVCRDPFKIKCLDGTGLITQFNPHKAQARDYSSCPQAVPKWMSADHRRPQENGSMGISGHEVEDCLFLDIFVPESVWKRTQKYPNLGFAPTLVWIHGGGFTSGSKQLKGGPTALLARTMEFHNSGAVIVSINYRLGLFGFLYGEKDWLDGEKDIVSNVGLLDQRMALAWIQKHIQKFGGDPHRVTVIGEGAGAGAILHHITAPNMTRHLFRHYKKPAKHYQVFPFRSAVMQSPTFQPMVPAQLKLQVDKVSLRVLSPSTSNMIQVLIKASELSGRRLDHLAQLRQLPYKVLYDVNTALVQESPYGTFTFGPVVDHRKSDKAYVVDSPLRRLKAGKMKKNIKVLVGYRKHEGRFLTPPSAGTNQGFQAHLAEIFPTVSQRHVKYVSDQLYPISDYDDGDQSGMNRSADALQDLFMGCNVHYLLAFMARSYGYVLDTAWSSGERFLEEILVRGGGMPGGASKMKRVGKLLQGVFVQFGMFSAEAVAETKLLPYHTNRTVMLASDDGLHGFVSNAAVKQQCRYWAFAPYEVIA